MTPAEIYDSFVQGVNVNPISTVAIRQLRPEFKVPDKIEMAVSQILAIKW